MSNGWKQYRDHVKQQSINAYNRAQNPIEWCEGEQQALIEKALAEGKVTKCPPAAFTEGAFSPYIGGIRETTVDNMLPVRRANMREYFGKGY